MTQVWAGLFCSDALQTQHMETPGRESWHKHFLSFWQRHDKSARTQAEVKQTRSRHDVQVPNEQTLVRRGVHVQEKKRVSVHTCNAVGRAQNGT